MKCKAVLICVIVAMAWAIPPAVAAATISFNFTGHLEEVSWTHPITGVYPPGENPWGLDRGTLFEGEFSLDDALVPSSVVLSYFEIEFDTCMDTFYWYPSPDMQTVFYSPTSVALDFGTTSNWLRLTATTFDSSFDWFSALGFHISGELDQISNMSSPVPEPATILMLGSGLAGFLGFRLRGRRKESRRTSAS